MLYKNSRKRECDEYYKSKTARVLYIHIYLLAKQQQLFFRPQLTWHGCGMLSLQDACKHNSPQDLTQKSSQRNLECLLVHNILLKFDSLEMILKS